MSTEHTELENLLNSGYRYAYALSSHVEMSQDLVHEAWLRVLKKHGTEPDKALLYRVIRNLFIDDYRHKTRFPSQSLNELDIEDTLATDPTSYAGTNVPLAQALHTLRPDEREVLFLWVFEGYTAAEIGQLNNQARGTILSKLHRAKEKLRIHLEADNQNSLTVIDGHRKSRA